MFSVMREPLSRRLNFSVSARLLEKAATFGEKDPAVLSKIGDLYVLTRQTDKALPFYRKVVELRPSYPQIREKLAGCLDRDGSNGCRNRGDRGSGRGQSAERCGL